MDLDITPAAISADTTLSAVARQVEKLLRRATNELPPQLRCGADFHFGFRDVDGADTSSSRGKMLRPALVLAAARAVSEVPVDDEALRSGVAVELVHNFSLLHDDVMDGDRTRRGRNTVWAQFGVPYAILLGDAMLALSNQLMARSSDAFATACCAELSSAVVNLCLGQHQDMIFEQSSGCSVEAYLTMAGGKTASLLSSACVIGAMVGHGTTGQVLALRKFGFHAGLAFQLTDDLLGIFGDPGTTGKPVGADLLRYKKSMPVVVAMQSDSAEGRELTEMYRDRALDESVLARATNLVEQAGGRDRTRAEALRQRDLAVACLSEVDGTPSAVSTLRTLADFLLDRNR